MTPPAGAEGALAERLEALLRSVATQFRLYERNHAVKRTLDGDEKAAVNKRYADHVESEGATILRALRSDAGRAVALEEAAQKVEQFAQTFREVRNGQVVRALIEAAERIRSLQPAGLRVLTAAQRERIDATTQQLASAWNMQAWNEHCDALRDAGLIDGGK